MRVRLLMALFAVACGSTTDTTPGGVPATGGGGQTAGSGGQTVSSDGQTAGTGGASTGGTSTGGASTGGASTGGASTGGASTGGASAGGTSTGGTSTGGGASSGGAAGTGGSIASGGGGTGGGGPVACVGTTLDLDANDWVDAGDACALSIPPPPSGQIDFRKINVYWTSEQRTVPTPLPGVQNEQRCPPGSAEGWYYDDPSNPKRILLCTGSCVYRSLRTYHVVHGCVTMRGDVPPADG